MRRLHNRGAVAGLAALVAGWSGSRNLAAVAVTSGRALVETRSHPQVRDRQRARCDRHHHHKGDKI